MRPGYKQTEVGTIPLDWTVVRLDHVASVSSGKRLPLGSGLVDRDTGHPYIRVVDMVPGSVRLDDIRFVPANVAPAIDRYRVDAGDLFISVAGTLGIAGRVPPELHGANLTENADRVVAHACNPLLLMHLLLSPIVQGVIESERTVGAQPKLALVRIRAFALPLPPSPREQQAIANALSDADALVESLEALIAKKRQLKKGAMQELLTGRRRLPGFSDEWWTRRIGELCDAYRGVSYDPSDLVPTDAPDAYRLLRANNVQDGRLVLDDVQRVPQSCVSHDQQLRSGDIVVCSANGSRDLVGKSAVFMVRDEHRYTFGAFMTVVRPRIDYDSGLLQHLFGTHMFRSQVQVLLAGSSINNLSPGSIKSFEIRVPSNSDERLALAAVLSDMDAEIDALEARLEKARRIKQGMTQELLTGRTRLVR